MSPDLLNKILSSGGDLSGLTRDEQSEYYLHLCETWALDAASLPIAYYWLTPDRGKPELRVYFKKNAAEQLAKNHNLTIHLSFPTCDNGIFFVKAKAVTAEGTSEERVLEDIGAVNLEGLYGARRSNAIMHAATKAKRRVTLAFLGVGLLDETEIEDISGAMPIRARKDGSPELSLKTRILKLCDRRAKGEPGWVLDIVGQIQTATGINPPETFQRWEYGDWRAGISEYLDRFTPTQLLKVLDVVGAQSRPNETKSQQVVRKLKEVAGA